MTNQPTTLFVFGVNETVSGQEIEEKLGDAGSITHVKNTLKGYAFVTFASRAEAENCIKIYNGRIGFDQPLQIKFGHAPSDASQARTPWYGKCVELKRCKWFNNGGCDQEAFFCEWGLHSCLWCWNKEKVNRHHGNTGNCPLKTKNFKDFRRLEPPPPPIEQPNGGRETREVNVTGPAGEKIVFVEDVPPEPAVSLVGHASTEGAVGGESSQGNSRPGQPSPLQPSPLQPSPRTSETENHRVGRRGVQTVLQSSSSAVSTLTRQPSSQQQQLQQQQQKARVQAQLHQRRQHHEQQRKDINSFQRCESADQSTTSSTVIPSTSSSSRNNSLSLSQISEDRTGALVSGSSKLAAVDGDITNGRNLDDSVELQYSRFKMWISQQRVEQLKRELIQLLFPLFTNLYIQLLVRYPGRSAQSPARRFLKAHHAIFLTNPEFKRFIQQLYEANVAEDLENNAVVVAFRAAKYTVTLTDQAYKHLMNYLENTDSGLLLQTLNKHVDIQIRDPLGSGARQSRGQECDQSPQNRREARLDQPPRHPQITRPGQNREHGAGHGESSQIGRQQQNRFRGTDSAPQLNSSTGKIKEGSSGGYGASRSRQDTGPYSSFQRVHSTSPGSSSSFSRKGSFLRWLGGSKKPEPRESIHRESSLQECPEIRGSISTSYLSDKNKSLSNCVMDGPTFSIRNHFDEWEKVNQSWKKNPAPLVDRVKKSNNDGGGKPYTKETFQDPVRSAIKGCVLSSPVYRDGRYGLSPIRDNPAPFQQSSPLQDDLFVGPNPTFQQPRPVQDDLFVGPNQAGDNINWFGPTNGSHQDDMFGHLQAGDNCSWPCGSNGARDDNWLFTGDGSGAEDNFNPFQF